MRIKPDIAISQKATIAPRLYQGLRILRMNATELTDHIRQEIAENPALELPEPGELEEGERVPLENTSMEEPSRDLWADYESFAGPGVSGAGSGAGQVSPTDLAKSPVTLADHLVVQLDLLGLDDDRLAIGRAILGSLDEHGYLRESVEEIARITGGGTDEVEEMLEMVQGFDPPGVAARGLEECLCLQIHQLGESETACRIAEEFLDEVARGAFRSISRQLGIPVSQVKEEVELLRSLNPAPGDAFDETPPPAAAIPDIFAEIRDGSVHILSSRESMPHLHISRLYRRLGSGKQGADSETAAYARSRVDRANELISDIERRRSTLTDVAGEIVEAQREFFTKGPMHLRPLTLEAVAAKLNLHPSTVSRAILGKFISTPHGIFEFKYFFASGYEAGDKELSSTAIKNRIEKLIAGEDAVRPLSDQKLADILGDEGVDISRRTVAKYRSALGIAPSRERKTSGGARSPG